jgi:hypothetical protein
MLQGSWKPAISRSLGLDDDVLVPDPDVGGLSHMWSMAYTLARHLSEHLQGLRDEYTKVTPADESSKEDMVEQLIDRFEADIKALEHVRQVCWRTYSINALQDLPPYYDAVLTLQTRLNLWLAAWIAHKERRQGRPSNNDNQATADQVKQHLKDWLDEVDRYPKYLEEMPLYVEPDTPPILPGGCVVSKPKPEDKKEEGNPEEPPMGNAAPSILDFRTPTRRLFDHQSRQRDT